MNNVTGNNWPRERVISFAVARLVRAHVPAPDNTQAVNCEDSRSGYAEWAACFYAKLLILLPGLLRQGHAHGEAGDIFTG